MNFKTVALLHPGNMGATIGAAAATSGARVIWVSHQRSQATQDRAKRAGLVDVKNLGRRSSRERSHSFCLPARRRSGTRPEGGGA